MDKVIAQELNPHEKNIIYISNNRQKKRKTRHYSCIYETKRQQLIKVLHPRIGDNELNLKGAKITNYKKSIILQ